MSSYRLFNYLYNLHFLLKCHACYICDREVCLKEYLYYVWFCTFWKEPSINIQYKKMLTCNLYIRPNKRYRCIWKALLSLILMLHYNTPLKLVCRLIAFTICCPIQQMVDRCFSAQKVAWEDSICCSFAVCNVLLCTGAQFNKCSNQGYALIKLLRYLHCIQYINTISLKLSLSASIKSEKKTECQTFCFYSSIQRHLTSSCLSLFLDFWKKSASLWCHHCLVFACPATFSWAKYLKQIKSYISSAKLVRWKILYIILNFLIIFSWSIQTRQQIRMHTHSRSESQIGMK